MSIETAISWGFIGTGFLLLAAFVRQYLIVLHLAEADARRWGEFTEWEERALETVGPALTRLYWTTVIVAVAAAIWFTRDWITAVWAVVWAAV